MNIKYRINYFQYMEFQALRVYLEEMAKKGWFLEKIGYVLKFRKKEPQDLIYTVDFLPKITLFSTQNIEEAVDYRQYCKESGWDFACGYNKMQIFSAKAQDDPTPIQTEEMIQYKVLHKSNLPIFLTTLVCFAFCMFSLYQIFAYDASLIQKENDLASFLFISVLITMVWTFAYLIQTIYLLIRNKKRINAGLTMRFPTYRTVKIFHMISTVLAAFICFSFIFPILLTPYPDFYVFNNLSVIFFCFAAPLFGISVALLREHTHLESGIIGMCLMIALILCFILPSFSSDVLSMNKEKISFLNKHDPLFQTIQEKLSDDGTWSVLNSSTSHEIPIFYEIEFTKDGKRNNAIYDEDQGLYLSAYQMRSKEDAMHQLKEVLIEDYRFRNGHMRQHILGIDWVYAKAPDDATLYATYPSIDTQIYQVEEGYQLNTSRYLIRKGNMVYIFSAYFDTKEDNEAHLSWFQEYFANGGTES